MKEMILETGPLVRRGILVALWGSVPLFFLLMLGWWKDVPSAIAEMDVVALERPLGDKALADQMGRSVREHVRLRFSSDRLVADIRSLYIELLNRRSSGSQQ